MFDNILKTHPTKNSTLQIESINVLSKIFQEEKVEQLSIDNYLFEGVRGDYLNKENYCLNFKFKYQEFSFEFFLMYDQLEYYIEQNTKKLAESNLEDFNKNTMLNDFIKYLRKDLAKFKID